MKFRLVEVDIKKFKGVNSKSYEPVIGCRNITDSPLDSQGYDIVTVFGENGSGKTTIAESIKLLFSSRRDKYKDYDLQYFIECTENTQKAIVKLNLRKGILGKEQNIFCLTCNSDACIHVRKLRDILNSFQEIAIERESSSLNLYFYHRFSGDKIEFSPNNFKKLLFNTTGIKNIEDTIESLSSIKKKIRHKKEIIEKSLVNIENKVISISDRIMESFEEVREYNTTLYSRIIETCNKIVYLLPKEEGKLLVKTEPYEEIKSNLINISQQIKNLLFFLGEEKSKQNKIFKNLEQKKDELKEEEDKIQTSINNLETVRNNIKKRIFELERILKIDNSLSDEDYLFNTDYKEVLEELLEISKEYTKLNKEKEDLEEQLESLKRKISELMGELNKICTLNIPPTNHFKENLDDFTYENIENLINSYEKFLEKSEEEFRVWKINALKEIRSKKTEAKDLCSKIDKVRKEIQDINNRIENLRDKLEHTQLNVKESIKKLLNKKEEEIKRIEQKIENLEKEKQEKANERYQIMNELSKIKENINRLSFVINKIKQGKEFLDFILHDEILKLISERYNLIYNRYKKLKKLIQLTECLIKHQILNLEALEDKILEKLSEYISERATNYFEFLTEHARFKEVKISYKAKEFIIELKDSLENEYKRVEETPHILNGQAIASLNLSLQVSVIELIKDSLEDTFSILILDDPTQAFDRKRKKNFVKFLNQLVNHGIQIILFTFDENLLRFSKENKISGIFIELLDIPFIVEKIKYEIHVTNDIIPQTESSIKITKCTIVKTNN